MAEDSSADHAEKATPAESAGMAARRRFLFWLIVSAGGLSVLSALDSGVSARDQGGTAGEAALGAVELFLYLWPWYLLLAALAAVGMAAAGWLRDRAAFAGLSVPSGDDLLEDAAAAASPVAGGILWAWYLIVFRAAVGFQNHELGSALVVALAAGTLIGLFAVWPGLFLVVRAVRRRVARPALRRALVWIPAMVLPLLALVWITRTNEEGIRALGALVVIGPAGALASMGVAALFARKVAKRAGRRAKRALAAIAMASAAAAVSIGFLDRDVAATALDGELFSRTLVIGLRAVTDVDRDGYSSLFGGGDCAPLNKAINPGARDVPGDGVDQNCTGADAAVVAEGPPPPWVDHPPAEGRARNAVVITIEALRADHVSALGHPLRTTPNIDALAARSTLFTTTYSASSATILSLPAFWSARPPSRIPAKRGKKHLVIDASTPWIPEMLKNAGFATAAFLPDYQAFDPAAWNMGFQRGFSTYDVKTHVEQASGAFHGFPSAEIVPRACQWIAATSSRRFLLWTHFVEPHLAYEVPTGAPDFGPGENGLYSSDVWAADAAVGALVQCLEKQGRLTDTVVIVTGDHGESLGEHGHHGHYRSVYEPEVRTLGLLYVPGVPPRASDVPVVHEDLSTTLLNLLGVQQGFAELRGRNLIPALLGQRVEPTSFIVELEGFGASAHTSALVDYPMKMIHKRGAVQLALYDVAADPGEKTDLTTRQPSTHARMKAQLLAHVESVLPDR